MVEVTKIIDSINHVTYEFIAYELNDKMMQHDDVLLDWGKKQKKDPTGSLV